MMITKELIQEVAPTQQLRVAINVGNPILARRTLDGGVAGVSVDLAKQFASELGVPIQYEVFETAGESVEALSRREADVGFFAIDPKRGESIAFTAPYVLIEGAYLVREESALRDNSEVDRAGHRVVVGKGSAYDLYLSRALQHAQIERAPTSPAVVDFFISVGADVAAGVKQQLELDVRRLAGLRVLPGRFMIIQQAMGVPVARPRAIEALRHFVERMKATGFVAEALQRHNIDGATVAPLAEGQK